MKDDPLLCHINAINRDERDRHYDLVARWREAATGVTEIPTGYAFSFPPEMAILAELAEFIGRERLCCPFFHFEIVVEANGGPIWLRLMGSEQVKTFVRENMIEH